MREKFPGFYRPSDDEFESLWRQALIVPDANVLLALYRVSDGTRGKLLEIFEKLADRIFVPHQAAFEFQRSRIRVIDEQKQAYATVEKQVKEFARKVGGGMRRHPRLDKEDLEQRVSAALGPVEQHLAAVRADHPDPLASQDVLGADSIRDKLAKILEGRIGEPRDSDDLVKTGRRRYEAKEPPGYEDVDKDEPDRYGDLSIWLDMIAKAQESKKDVIFVTEERKEDWWWKREDKILAPRSELVEEMRRETGRRFYMYSLERFMALAAEKLEIDLSDEERDDVARAGDAAAEEPWITIPPSYPYLTEPPLASGFSNPQHHGNYFRPSPAARRGSYLSGFESSELPFNLSAWSDLWEVKAEPSGDEVELGITFRPYFQQLTTASNFTCEVRTPGGEAFQASIISKVPSATLRYPSQFQVAAPPEAGRYLYKWRYSPSTSQTQLQVGAGSFELEP